MSGVATYPKYLLRIPSELREKLAAEAKQRGRSLSGLTREILNERYGVVDVIALSEPKAEMDEMLLRLPPSSLAAIRAEARESGKTMRRLVLEALEAHYDAA